MSLCPDGEYVGQFEARRRRLPHWEEPGATCFVTFSLQHPAAIDLTRSDIAPIVISALRHFDNDRYMLYGYTAMPDHVHVILKPTVREGRAERLSRILDSLKGWIARRINEHLGRLGRLWQPESFDRIIRDEAEYDRIAEYILHNPRMRDLVEDPLDWPWWGQGLGER